MKTKFLPLAFMLILSFCFSCSKKKQTSSNTPQTVLEHHLSAGPNDKLELDTKTQKIYATFYLKVKTSNFKQQGNPELFEIPIGSINAHGLAYRYVDLSYPDNPDDGENVDMKVEFKFDNVENWEIGNKIKIMSLNEKSDSVFRFLRPYFKERLMNYPESEMTKQELINWNTSWNNRNEDRLDVNSYVKNKEIFTPKLTKQDMIIKLTKK